TMSDWRQHYRAHPAWFVAAAAALGFVLVPQKAKAPRAFFETGQPSNGQAAPAPAEQAALPKKSIAAVALGLAANFAARQVATLAARHGREMMQGFVAAAMARRSAPPRQPAESETDPLWQ